MLYNFNLKYVTSMTPLVEDLENSNASECVSEQHLCRYKNLVWYVCVSEENKAVQQIADSIQDLSVEANSDAASSDPATGTTNPASITTADNWGTSYSLSRLLQKPSTDRRQTVDWQWDWKPDQDWSSGNPYLLSQ